MDTVTLLLLLLLHLSSAATSCQRATLSSCRSSAAICGSCAFFYGCVHFSQLHVDAHCDSTSSSMLQVSSRCPISSKNQQVSNQAIKQKSIINDTECFTQCSALHVLVLVVPSSHFAFDFVNVWQEAQLILSHSVFHMVQKKPGAIFCSLYK